MEKLARVMVITIGLGVQVAPRMLREVPVGSILAPRVQEVSEESGIKSGLVSISILEGKVEMAGMAVAVEEETPEEEGGRLMEKLVVLTLRTLLRTNKEVTQSGRADSSFA